MVSTLPDDCPKIECPMESADFIQRMERIDFDIKELREKLERELKENREYRHERNAAIATTIDEIRLDIDRLHQAREKDNDDRRDERHDLKNSINGTNSLLSTLTTILKGEMGRQGVIGEISTLESRVQSLEGWRIEMKTSIRNGQIVGTLISTGITTVAAITTILLFINPA